MMDTSARADLRGRPFEARLRPSAKVLPEHGRAHNRSLVLQQLFRGGPTSRAEIARQTGLTRVTVSDLVAALIAEGLIEELGTVSEGRVGKPATLIAMRTEAFQIVAVDLTDGAVMRGAVTTLTRQFVARRELAIEGRTGQSMVDLLERFCRLLLSDATAPVIGVGIGSPGVIDGDGQVLSAPNRGWYDVPLAEHLTERLGLPVHVANDANTATLAEFTFADGDEEGLMVVTIGEGVGAGLMVGGLPIYGASWSAGEIGHVTAVDVDPLPCACGRAGCLETVLAAPALERATEGLAEEDSEAYLASVGRTLGVILAPIVSALNLVEVVLSGPEHLLDGPLREAAEQTVKARTCHAIRDHVEIRMSSLNEEAVLSGATVLVLSGQLGVS